MAIKTDGTLWAWGYNSIGQLGLNDRVHRSSPTQIGTLTNWNLVNTRMYVGVAIKTNGTLWLWGNNDYGQLGLNTGGPYIHRSSPVQVGLETTWISASVGGQGLLAIKS